MSDIEQRWKIGGVGADCAACWFMKKAKETWAIKEANLMWIRHPSFLPFISHPASKHTQTSRASFLPQSRREGGNRYSPGGGGAFHSSASRNSDSLMRRNTWPMTWTGLTFRDFSVGAAWCSHCYSVYGYLALDPTVSPTGTGTLRVPLTGSPTRLAHTAPKATAWIEHTWNHQARLEAPPFPERRYGSIAPPARWALH